MKYLKSCGYLALAGIMAGLCGCASTVDSLSNNTSGDMIRGVKLQAGVDMSSGEPVPSVNFSMGSLSRKGKGDRMVMVIDNNTTDIVSENYNVEADNVCVGVGKVTTTTYQNATETTKVQSDMTTQSSKPRQILIKEKRMATDKQLEEGIIVHQDSSFGMGVTAGNLMSLGGTTIISIGKVGANAASAFANTHSADGIKAVENKTLKPIAKIKAPSKAKVKETITLDGSDSEPKDKNKDTAYVYKWEILGKNTTTVANADKQQASFTTETTGDYEVQLTVHYNNVASDPVKQTITVTN